MTTGMNTCMTMIIKNHKKIILKITAVLLVAAVIFVAIKILLQNRMIPKAKWMNRVVANEQIKVTLDDKMVLVSDANSSENDNLEMILWKSEDNILVQDVLLQDIDENGEDELLLLCFKRGRYGKHRPFWIEDDETVWSQHVYIYDFIDNEVRPKWMASDIGIDVDSWDYDLDNKCIVLIDSSGEKSYWKWLNWGLAKIDPAVRILVAGDNIIHMPILKMAQKEGMNFDFAYEDIRDVVQKYDIAAVVQETPLVDDGTMYSDYPEFGTPKEVARALKKAGFDMALCATNHMMDKGVYGVETTRDVFESEEMICLGIEDLEYLRLNKKGMVIGMLDYTYGLNGHEASVKGKVYVHTLVDEKKIRESIRRARSECDAVIMFVHWGTEYDDNVDDYQERWVQIFSEEGVDVVIGSHPHVVQKSEMITNDKGHKMIVFYSLGNFLSAQTEEDRRNGIMAEINIMKSDGSVIVDSYSKIDIEDVYDNGIVKVKIK